MTDDEELIEQVAELQLAAFLAGRGSVTGMKNGTRVAKPAPSMGDFRRMAQSAILPIIKAERAEVRAELVAEIVDWLRDEANGWMCADTASSEIEAKFGGRDETR